MSSRKFDSRFNKIKFGSSEALSEPCETSGTKYSRMDQVKFVEDRL